MSQTLEQLRTGQLLGSRRLQLACGLTDFPSEIFDLADTLEILDLSGNALTALPDDLPRLYKLRIIFCSENQFTELPSILGKCSQLSMIGFKANRIRHVPASALPVNLRWLILTDNLIEALPDEMGYCHQLQKLALAGNRLRALPQTMSACSGLELLRISANRLEEFPTWLLSLPSLTWLAYAGNPFCEALELQAFAATPVAEIEWDTLQLQQQLGEGASGVIYKAEYQQASERRDVAVKLFKGELTSDGLPYCEITAWLAAGIQPNLIPILGKVVGHPSETLGLVMPLIDAQFRNLAGPPSLDTCTRDVYPIELALDLTQVLGIALSIAAASKHLHDRGILHGDLYAHNIMHDSSGHAYLGDFGAASLFVLGTDYAHGLQQIEVRAFGVLLEELLERCVAPVNAHLIFEALLELKSACLHEQVQSRPLFDDIERKLSELL